RIDKGRARARRNTNLGLVLMRRMLLVALCGCRAAIGIEPLELGDGSTDAKIDSAADTGPSDSCATMPDNMACRNCCHMTYGTGFNTLESDMLGAMCICGAGKCTTECASGS